MLAAGARAAPDGAVFCSRRRQAGFVGRECIFPRRRHRDGAGGDPAVPSPRRSGAAIRAGADWHAGLGVGGCGLRLLAAGVAPHAAGRVDGAAAGHVACVAQARVQSARCGCVLRTGRSDCRGDGGNVCADVCAASHRRVQRRAAAASAAGQEQGSEGLEPLRQHARRQPLRSAGPDHARQRWPDAGGLDGPHRRRAVEPHRQRCGRPGNAAADR